MKKIRHGLLIILSFKALPSLGALEIPSKYTELLPYVQQAPDQGRSAACLYVGSTGVMELIANKKFGNKNPKPYGPYDLSESFLISQKALPDTDDKLFIEKAVLKFNWGYGISAKEWDFDVWNGSRSSRRVWDSRDWSKLPKVELPKIETIPIVSEGNRWATNVLDDSHIVLIKEALVTHHSPILISYNDNKFWHVIMIVGYDDHIPGNCYQISAEQCGERKGAFYIRDSFGLSVELRDYDWFRVRGNHAVVVKEAEE